MYFSRYDDLFVRPRRIPVRRAVNGLNRENVKEALGISGNLEVKMIKERDIQEIAEIYNYDATTPLNRARIIKDMYVGTLKDGEYMAIATDAVIESEAEKVEKNLRPELHKGISIRVLVGPEDKRSVFSLSKIINDWLGDIQKNDASTIKIILPAILTPSEMIEKLRKATQTAWMLLIQA